LNEKPLIVAYRNTGTQTRALREHKSTKEHKSTVCRPGMQRSTGGPQEHCRAQMEHGLITDGTLIEHEVRRD
jgi:hypothetical protein